MGRCINHASLSLDSALGTMKEPRRVLEIAPWLMVLMLLTATADDATTFWPGRRSPDRLHAWNMTPCEKRGHFESYHVPTVAASSITNKRHKRRGGRIAIEMSGELREAAMGGFATLQAYILDAPAANGTRFPIDIFWHLWVGASTDTAETAAEAPKNRGFRTQWSSARDEASQPAMLRIIRSMPETRAVVTERFASYRTIIKEYYEHVYGVALPFAGRLRQELAFLSQWYKVAQCHSLVRQHARLHHGDGQQWYVGILRSRPDIHYWRRLNLHALWLETATLAEEVASPGRNWLAVSTNRMCTACTSYPKKGGDTREIQDSLAFGTPAAMDFYAAPKLLIRMLADSNSSNGADLRAATTGEQLKTADHFLFVTEKYLTWMLQQVFREPETIRPLNTAGAYIGHGSGDARKNFKKRLNSTSCDLSFVDSPCQRLASCPHNRCPVLFKPNLCGYNLGQSPCETLGRYTKFRSNFLKTGGNIVFGCASNVRDINDRVDGKLTKRMEEQRERDFAKRSRSTAHFNPACFVAQHGHTMIPVDCAAHCVGGTSRNGSFFRPLHSELVKWMQWQAELSRSPQGGNGGGDDDNQSNIRSNIWQRRGCEVSTWVHSSEWPSMDGARGGTTAG